MVQKPTNKAAVYTYRVDRMGSRLIAILNAIRIAKDYDLPLKIYWPVTNDTSEEIKDPSQIFSDAFIAEYFVTKEEFESLQPKMFEVAARNPGWTTDKIKSQTAGGKNLLVSHAFASIAVFPEEDEKTVRAGVADAFDYLVFNPNLSEMISRINAVFEDTPPIAYHIRRGDIIDPTSNAAKKIWPKKYTPREFYHIHLKRHIAESDAKILVFSDEPREISQLKKLSKNVLALDDIIDIKNLNTAQTDFLNLYAMSRCKEIIGPPGSGFSETAALIGNGGVIDVQQTLSQDDHNAAMALLVQNLESGPEHFLGLADVGQTLPFAAAYWSQIKDTKKGAEIVRSYYDRGLNRAYIFVIMCELYLAHGDAKSALEIRTLARQENFLFDIAMANLNLLCVNAHLHLNEIKEANQSLSIALWSFPNIQNAERTALGMLMEKKLSKDGFFPFDENLQRLALPGSPAAGGDTPGGYAGQAPIQIPFFSIDMITRDWSLFFGKRRHRLFHHHDRIEQLYERVVNVTKKVSPAYAFNSMCALYLSEMDQIDDAIKHHKLALKEAPENPLYLKRYAQSLLKAGKNNDAISLLHDAVNAAQGQILYSATLAEAYADSKQIDAAIETYLPLLDRAENFPEILLRGAGMLSRRKPYRTKARSYGLQAVQSSQGSARVLNAYAGILKRCGSKVELLAVLQSLRSIGTLRPKLSELHDELKAELGA